METERGDARVVDARAVQLRRRCNLAQSRKIPISLANQLQIAAREPGIHARKACVQWSGNFEKLRMSDDSHKLMDARPGNCPRRRLASQCLDQFLRGLMKRAVRAMGINEQIGVRRNHAPRPW